ncbi:MAG: cyclophilin-like fold protein [Thermoplasmata archaeon]
MTRIRIRMANQCEIAVRLREEATTTIRKLLDSLPFRSRGNRWGDEIYFEAPFHSDLEDDARQDMEIGDVAYWPDGDAIAIFFGLTPISTSHRPRAYSACNVVGRVEGDMSPLRAVMTGAVIEVEPV